jgi:hypothetical protein
MKEQSHVSKTIAPIQQSVTAQRVSFNDNRPSTSRINAIQRMANNATQPIQLKSKVVNQGQDYTWGANKTKVGHKMQAWLEPGSLVQGESANLNKDQDAMMTAIRSTYGIVGGDLVKGHLLNDNLGGKAMNNNLFPITRAANKQHLLTTENYAKEELWGNKKPIWYTVEVVGTPNINTHQQGFKVSIGSWAGGTNYGAIHPAAVSGTITSNLGSPKDKDEANSEDMETYSAKRLSYAISHGLALAPKTTVGSLSDADKNAREQTGNVTNTEHGPSGYTSAS